MFGIDKNVDDLPYHGGLDQVHTVDGNQAMATLTQILDLLCSDSYESRLAVLDIKLNNSTRLIEAIATTIKDHKGNNSMEYWRKKLIIGIWHPRHLGPVKTHLPAFAITNIAMSLSYSRKHFMYDEKVESLNVLFTLLRGRSGQQFINEAHQLGKHVMAWTVNGKDSLLWTMSLGLKGITTDNPEELKDLVDLPEPPPKDFFTIKRTVQYFLISLLARVM